MKLFHKKSIVFVLIALLVFSLFPGLAMAEEGDSDEVSCTCTSQCVEGESNEECAVCSADYTACLAKVDTEMSLDSSESDETSAEQSEAAENTEGAVATQGDIAALAAPIFITLGGSNISYGTGSSGDPVFYDASTETLYLTSYRREGDLRFQDGHLTIVLEGENELSYIFGENDSTLTIQGAGSLEIKNPEGSGIRLATGDLNLLGGTITIDSLGTSVEISKGNLNVSGGTLNAHSSDAPSLYLEDGNLNQTKGSIRAVSELHGGIRLENGDINITGGEISGISNGGGLGISLYGGNIIANGGSITGSAEEGTGISFGANGEGSPSASITASNGGKVFASGGYDGIFSTAGTTTLSAGKGSSITTEGTGSSQSDFGHGFATIGNMKLEATDDGFILVTGKLGSLAIDEGTPKLGGSFVAGFRQIDAGSLSSELFGLDAPINALATSGITLSEKSKIKEEGQSIIALADDWYFLHAIGANGAAAEKTTIVSLASTDNDKKVSGSPSTSDDAQLGLWIAIILASGVVLYGVRSYRKRVS